MRFNASTMSSVLAGEVPADRRGQTLGYQQSAGSLARAVGPAVAGVLYQHVGVPAPFVVGAVLVVTAFLLVPRTAGTASPAALPTHSG